MRHLREHCREIARYALDQNLPDESTRDALKTLTFDGPITCLALGKAAWTMAKSALDELGDRISGGLVITKKGHSLGRLPRFTIMESGHPIPDGSSVEAGRAALDLASSLKESDHLLVLLSGGGSSLMELPAEGVSLEEMATVTDRLISSGAPIGDINTVRKRLSKVKAGRLAQAAYPASVTNLILSDVLGNDLEAVASGPTLPDRNTSEEAMGIALKYGIYLSQFAKKAIGIETPKYLKGIRTSVVGDVKNLCSAAGKKARAIGYDVEILAVDLDCEAREAGSFIAAIARQINGSSPRAFILGGETVVHLKGKGKGGRNQELALSAAIGMEGVANTAIMSLGSDGTDGPTDAAGGLVDGNSVDRMKANGVDPMTSLDENDSYNALAASGDLVVTGPTGTNVNDLILLLTR